ncbi:hypothetical protein K438DRAFT_1985075 [Mycena galopus ATCC 62051]|nr:hypothetical protein K438DRAFT_1985075 [Mycena galopus ATCC 62051]
MGLNGYERRQVTFRNGALEESFVSIDRESFLFSNYEEVDMDGHLFRYTTREKWLEVEREAASRAKKQKEEREKREREARVAAREAREARKALLAGLEGLELHRSQLVLDAGDPAADTEAPYSKKEWKNTLSWIWPSGAEETSDLFARTPDPTVTIRSLAELSVAHREVIWTDVFCVGSEVNARYRQIIREYLAPLSEQEWTRREEPMV